MLDDETPTTPDNTTPERPRRRRAASRPAGPPSAPPVETTPVQPAVAEPAAVVPVAEEPVDEPVTGPEAEATEAEAEEATEAEAEAEEATEAEVEAADDAEPAGPTGVAAVPVEVVAPAVTPEAPAEAAQVEESTPEPAKPTRSRSRRTRKPAAEPEAAQDALPAAEPTVAEPAPAEAPPVAEAAGDAADGVAASLSALEKRTGRRRGRVRAETFGMPADTDADKVLSSLAAAIGGGAPLEPTGRDDQAAAEAPDDENTDLDPLDAADDEAGEDDDLGDGEDSGSASRRRRRRRGGRRRRRSPGGEDSGADDTDEAEAGEGSDDEEDASESESEATETGEAPAAEGGSRRRRRRRRRGEDTQDSEDDPGTEVVVRVREPRRSRSVSDEVTGIEGSTRMEAKKQRRREGRAAGRRRSPVLSEAEFLARREAVDRVMLIRQVEDYTQIGVLEDGILVEHYVDRASANSMIGNIYLGRIQNVLPSMEAAFVDIGRGRNAVLYAGEVDWASFGVTGQDKKVERVFKSGQTVLVQVSKDPVGAKGARLTSHISIPGRYLVYSPGGQLSGISRKLPENERKRLKSILDDLIGPDASVIIRTAAEGASEDELVRDVNRLKAQWDVIAKKKTSGSAPSLLYGEPDLTVRIVRDLFTEDFRSLIVDGNGGPDDAWDTVEAYVSHVAPHLADRLQRWDRTKSGDLFSAHRVHEQVAKALERKVFLPSGGSLIIDRTEAMTVVDVNTGRFTGTSGNLEATVTSNNLEAAEEIVRQLRLRDIGGIIVIDFIDMVLPSNRELLLRRLVECLGRDRTRHQVAEVTSLGLVQMTRKKIGTGLAEAFTVPCETCKGRGYHTHDVPVATQVPADGGDRDGNRRGGGRQQSQRSSRTRKPSVAPELAAVVAATLAHPVSPELAQAEPDDADQVPAVEVSDEQTAAEPTAAEQVVSPADTESPAEEAAGTAVEPEPAIAEPDVAPEPAAPAEPDAGQQVEPEPAVPTQEAQPVAVAVVEAQPEPVESVEPVTAVVESGESVTTQEEPEPVEAALSGAPSATDTPSTGV